MSGYLPYLIKTKGYRRDLIIEWIEKQLSKYYPLIVTTHDEGFNIIVYWENACYVYEKKFKEVLGVPVKFVKLDMELDIMVFRIFKKDLMEFNEYYNGK